MQSKTIVPDKPMRRGWILAALMFTMMLAAMDATIVSTAIPQIVGDLGGFSLFSWVFSIYLLVQTITIPVYGKLADIYGRKPILIIGTIVFLIGSASCGAAWNMHSLITFRGVQALGAGAIMATVNTLAGDIYSIKERAKIQGWLSSVWGISAILGPALGGAFAEYISWRWIFLMNLPIGAISIALIVIFLHEEKPQILHKIDFKGAVLMLLSGTVIMFGLLEGGQSWPWISWNTGIIILAAIILVALTIRTEGRSPEPIMPGWVWKNRVLLGSNLAMVGMGLVMMGPNMFLPVFAQSVTGLGAIAAGFVLASMSITWPISSSLSGRLYLRIGFRNTAILGVILAFLSILLFLFVPFPGVVWMMVALQMLLGAGFGLMSTPVLIGVQSIVPWNKRGVVTGANMFSRYLGQSIGAAVFATVFNTTLSNKLADAPVALQGKMPGVNKVIETLQSHEASGSIQLYLRESFFVATKYVYAGMTFFAVLTLAFLLLIPARFPVVEEGERK